MEQFEIDLFWWSENGLCISNIEKNYLMVSKTSSFDLPWVYNLWNPLYGETPSDFEEDLDPIDEEEDDDDEHQAGVAAVEDVTVELMVLKNHGDVL